MTDVEVNGDYKDVFMFEKGKIVGGEEECIYGGKTVSVDYISSDWGTVCFLSYAYRVANLIFYFFLSIPILLGIIAGYQFITSKNKLEKIKLTKITKGKKFLKWMIVAFIIAGVVKIMLLYLLFPPCGIYGF